jgi:hypothetical protein
MEILLFIGLSGTYWMFIIVDTLAAIAIGAIGGAIYERVFAAPGRR